MIGHEAAQNVDPRPGTTQARLTRWAALALCAASACGRPPARVDASLVAAGDIASCWWRWDDATGRLLDHVGGVVVVLGDAAYQDGTARQLTGCYGPNWGRHKSRTRAVLGNHDRRTGQGAPFFAYFGTAAGEPGKGWWSFEQDGWHVVGLNSETAIGAGSEQLRWLAADLAAHPARCTLVAIHRPIYSSGKHGDARRLREVARILHAHRVDVVLSGHDHNYERFAPRNAAEQADSAGLVQFVVGTGGAPMYRPGVRSPLSRAFNSRVHGVLALRLRPDGYDWEFVPTRPRVFEDRGSGRCH
jgi:acid phosphatase type 7